MAYRGFQRQSSQHIFSVETRIHSSRMRTARLLTLSQHALPGGVPTRGCTCPGVYLPRGVCACLGGVYLPGGVPVQGVYLPRGGVPARGCSFPGGYLLRGVYLPGGCTCPGGTCLGTLPPCVQNDRQVQKYYLAPNFVCGR